MYLLLEHTRSAETDLVNITTKLKGIRRVKAKRIPSPQMQGNIRKRITSQAIFLGQ